MPVETIKDRPSSLRLELAGGPDAAAEARHALDGLGGRLGPQVMEDVRLLVSELVTNSVRHGGAGPSDSVGLEISVTEGRVHVEVRDPGNGFPDRPTPSPDAIQGRGFGLYLVDQLADRWGVADPGASCVWFEFDEAG